MLTSPTSLKLKITLTHVDHFLWNNNSTKDAKNVLHLPGNLSDHSPIYCETDIAYIDTIANKMMNTMKITLT